MGRKAQNHSVALRIQALALFEEGVPVERVKEITGMSRSAIFRLRQTAKARGYDPNVSRELKEEYVQDAPRSGRPRKDAADKKQEGENNNDNNNNNDNTEPPLLAEAAAEAAAAATAAAVAAAAAAPPALAPAPTTNTEHPPPTTVSLEDALKSAVASMDAAPIDHPVPVDPAISHVNGFLSAG